MATPRFRGLLRLLPLAILIAVITIACWRVEAGGPWAVRNTLPPLLFLGLAAALLGWSGGTWTGRGWRPPLALAGFAIPALGLTVYLHYAYAVNLDGMFDGGAGQLFRYLPVYTTGAGAIGAAIGWIVGGNVT
jgi:hypothetical protein